jgi:hypothetical protein
MITVAHEVKATLKWDLIQVSSVHLALPSLLILKSVNFITPAIPDIP